MARAVLELLPVAQTVVTDVSTDTVQLIDALEQVLLELSTQFDGFDVSLEIVEQISYALAYGGLPVLTDVTIRTSQTSRLANATVRLRLRSLGTPISETWSKTVTGGDSGRVVIERPDIIWKSDALLDIADTQPAEIDVQITEADGTESSGTIQATVGSADAWYQHSPIGPLSLAAFVRPNDPRLREILDVASRKLEAATGDGGLSGYQIPPKVLPMVQAVYEAVQDLNITYSDPPASWDMESERNGLAGQRIRSSASIIDERVGTCLDTAILFAALLENIGLFPLIAIVPGHAFVGLWAPGRYEETRLPTNQTGLLRNEINELDLGNLLFFETTAVARGDDRVAFSEAVRLGRENITNYVANTRLTDRSHYVDIVASRRPGARRVLPMPIRRVRPDGSVEVIEYKPEEFSVNILIDKLTQELAGREGGFTGVDLDVPPRLRVWLDSLLDLSLRNPLINFRYPKTSLPLVVPPGSLGVIEDLLAQETPMSVESLELVSDKDASVLLADPRMEPPALAAEIALDRLRSRSLIAALTGDGSRKLLRSMTSQARTVQEETGSNGLFLAMGFLSWDAERKQRFGRGNEFTTEHTPDKAADKNLLSPLILIPVTLTAKNRFREFTLQIDPDSPITPNFSLIEKLRRDYGVALDSLANLEEDDSGIDIPKALEGIRRTIQQAGLDGFRVDEGAVLGFFNFSTYRLWKDLVDNWRILTKAPLFHHLLHTPYQPFSQATPSSNPNPDPGGMVPTTPTPSESPSDEAASEEENGVDDASSPSDRSDDVDLDALIGELPIPADASQARAVAMASRGQTFVLQGPPGTGKSQTITNMLAHALQQGQRVLFVAQKKEALDVVKERLDQVGLGGFSLDLHDKNQSLKAVKLQLLDVLQRERSVDPVGFSVALKEYHQAFAPLRRYREKLHEKGAHNHSLYSAMDVLLATPGEASLPVAGAFIAQYDLEDVEEIHSTLQHLTETGPVAGTANDNPWSFANSWERAGHSEDDVRGLLGRLDRALAALSSHPVAYNYVLGISGPDELALTEAFGFDEATPMTALDNTDEQSRQARKIAEQSLTKLSERLEGQSVDYTPLRDFPIADIAQVERSSRVKGGIGRFFALGKLKKTINRLFGQEIVATRDDVGPVISTLEELTDLERAATADLGRVPGWRESSSRNLFDPKQLRSELDTLHRTASVVSLLDMSSGRAGASAAEVLNSLSDSIDTKTHLLEWTTAAWALLEVLHADAESIGRWQGSRSLGSALATALPALVEDANNHSWIQLQRWLQLMSDIEPLRSRGLTDATEQLLTGVVDYTDGPNAFSKGYYTALVDYLMIQQGFNTFDQAPINSFIKKFAEAQQQLQETLPEVLSAELIDRRGFDMSMKLGAIGDLLAELKKTTSRRGSVRTLLRKHWDLIRRITPCVLASPDSVVRFIDADLEVFDAVIFDEASMIKVGTALGAIGRAKAAVVVGDTKQMPPTSVAQAKLGGLDDDGDDEQVEDMESILSQVEVARLPEVMLKWHYRSEDESLIGFSNTHYYNEKLLTFPAATAKRPGYGLEFHHLPDGRFVRRSDKNSSGTVGTNPTEAQAIVDQIAQLLDNPQSAGDSIGVVTLNQPQQKLIEAMLQEHPSDAVQHALVEGVNGERLFVKNLETVQGTERDVILFSVAFSKNDRGALPLNFGPLNNAGGERRLNVAVTRSRKRMLVFSSFTGQELLAREPASEGVRQLGQFLQMAQYGPEATLASGSTVVTRDRHQESIAHALSQRGLHVKTDVGLSGFRVDIAVYPSAESTDATLGILLDGPRWTSRETVSDRDALPVSFLQNRMGWPRITRMWLPAWIRHQDDEIQRILRLIDNPAQSDPADVRLPQPTTRAEAKQRRQDEAAGQTPDIQPEGADWLDGSEVTPPETVSSFGVLSGDTPELASWDSFLESVDVWRSLRASVVGKQEYLDYLHAPQVQEVVRDIAKQLTDYEGPVSRERFAKFVAECFGFSRVVKNRIDNINKVPLPAHARDNEGFLYPVHTRPSEFTIWRRGGGHDSRSIAEISHYEIANAMVHLADVAMGISRDEIVTETARILGSQRNSAAIVSRLEQSLGLALQSERLIEDGGNLKTQT